MERHHDLQAAGLNLEKIELFHNLADCPAADLFDNSNAMIGIDDFIAYVEITVDADHEGTPTNAGHMRNNTSIVYLNQGTKGNLEAEFGKVWGGHSCPPLLTWILTWDS